MARFASPTGLLGAAVVAATAWASPAPGQGLDIRALFNAPGANTAGAPAATAGVQDWSGVSRAVFEANVAGLTPDLRIMDLLDAQPEFTKSFWDYLDILVNEDRIQ